MKNLIRRACHSFGFDIVRFTPSVTVSLPEDLSSDERMVLERINGFTMTSLERQIALIQSVRYLVQAGIAGCMVECGVWRGGSSMATALTLMQMGDANRDLYLYDTFSGMTIPTAMDQTADGTLAQSHLNQDKTGAYLCAAGIHDVHQNMISTGYDSNCIHLIEGPVEDTIPKESPKQPIALLRLDTDWYESTQHELIHLFPLLVEGGVLIIDDYGHWSGARKAVDEYLQGLSQHFYMHRIDYTGRLLIKQ
jgi:O-methyltransferase